MPRPADCDGLRFSRPEREHGATGGRPAALARADAALAALTRRAARAAVLVYDPGFGKIGMDMDDEAGSEAMDEGQPVQEARLWQGNGWTARVIKNEDDEGWAVAMFKDGQPEPALVGPWTMGRDKKNPKPLDTNAFNTLVKTAAEVIRRHEQHLHALLHKSTVVWTGEAELKVTLDIVPDDDDPYALLAAIDEMGEQVAQARVAPTFKLSPASALGWIENGFRAPR